MKRALIPVLAMVAAMAALPVRGLDLEAMSAAEREAFRAEIRAYLLDNPEIIMEAVAVLEQRQSEAQATADVELVRANAESLFQDTNSWVGGNPEGDITLVEFMDYRCGYCRRAAPEVAELLASDGNIRLVIKEFPILGEQSELSSRFAIATRQIAGDDMYKAVHDALIEFKGDVSEAALRRIAEGLGLAADEILAHMGSDAVSEVIAANHALGQRLGINGTPTFVMGEQMLRGYVQLDDMRQIAEEIRTQ